MPLRRLATACVRRKRWGLHGETPTLFPSLRSSEGETVVLEPLAVVLAAGESRRMGEPKLLLPFGDKTMIESLLDNLRRSKAGKILVVVGSHRQGILEKIGDRPVETVINRHYREGMLSSIQTGFEALPQDVPAALV